MEAYNRNMPKNYLDRDAFLKWSSEKDHLHNWLSDLRSEYQNYLANTEEHANWVDFLSSEGADGLMVHTRQYPGELTNWLYAAEYLKDRSLSWGYKLYSSEERSAGGQEPEVFLRHYLKPPVKNMLTKPVDQIFGNITIELKLKNYHTEALKFQVLHYNDQNYQPPLDIEELYRSVFDQD